MGIGTVAGCVRNIYSAIQKVAQYECAYARRWLGVLAHDGAVSLASTCTQSLWYECLHAHNGLGLLAHNWL